MVIGWPNGHFLIFRAPDIYRLMAEMLHLMRSTLKLSDASVAGIVGREALYS